MSNTKVKTYPRERAMRQGVKHMVAKGYTVRTTTFVPRSRGCIGQLIYLITCQWIFNLFWRKEDGYYQVTYQK